MTTAIPRIAGTILAPEIKRSGPGMTIKGTNRDTHGAFSESGFRRVFRGELDGGTGRHHFFAEHKDGRLFLLE